MFKKNYRVLGYEIVFAKPRLMKHQKLFYREITKR